KMLRWPAAAARTKTLCAGILRRSVAAEAGEARPRSTSPQTRGVERSGFRFAHGAGWPRTVRGRGMYVGRFPALIFLHGPTTRRGYRKFTKAKGRSGRS